jgi:hypothetical protein
MKTHNAALPNIPTPRFGNSGTQKHTASHFRIAHGRKTGFCTAQHTQEQLSQAWEINTSVKSASNEVERDKAEDMHCTPMVDGEL